MSENLDLGSLLPEEIGDLAVELGDKKFRGKQIFEWIHKKQIVSLDEAGNIPQKLKEELIKTHPVAKTNIVDCQISREDGTRKYLFGLNDGNVIESVLMRYHYGNTVCISSQVGCRMGCKFCASTLDGLVRGLTAGEMISQIYSIERDLGEKVGHIVIMGSGEPLDNYDNLIRFLTLISHPDGKNLSLRNVTVSTCGIVPKIYELADKHFQLTLALSLHASSQEKRKELMPIANKYDLSEVLTACSDYFETTGRRLSFEYTLIQNVNDSEKDAQELANLLKKYMKHFPSDAHVNLIPVNPIKERNYESTGKNRSLVFKKNLEKCGLSVTIRREMGRDIDGACGQLRRRYMEGNSPS